MNQIQDAGSSRADPGRSTQPAPGADWQHLAHERERALERLRRAWWVRLGIRLGVLEPPGPGEALPVPPDPDRVKRWRLSLDRGSIAHLVFPAHDSRMVRVAIVRAGWRNSWDIQLNLAGPSLAQGRRYALGFQARADRRRTIIVGVAQSQSPWQGLGLFRTIGLGTEWQYFREEFVAAAGEDHTRIHFDLAGASVPVELTEVHLDSSDANGPPSPAGGRQGNGE